MFIDHTFIICFKDYTAGINCERCIDGYYRPLGVPQTSQYPCRQCRCRETVGSTDQCYPDDSRVHEGFVSLSCTHFNTAYETKVAGNHSFSLSLSCWTTITCSPIELSSSEQSLDWVSSAELFERSPFPLRLDAIKTIVLSVFYSPIKCHIESFLAFVRSLIILKKI